MKFIDIANIYVKSGDGGNGIVSFRREKFVPKGGPDGGNGGKGGDVVLEVNSHITTLLDFKYKRKYIAEDGGKGQGANKTGRDGKSIVIKVPLGTIVKNADTDEVIADLDTPNMKYVIVKGGWGGKGNSEFVNSTRQAPRFATDGKPGEEYFLELELKLIADVGIVGFPNVGKSTLISVISAAKPKIADYHFTTLIPNLGIVKVEEYKNFVIADIPGLIEGASEGKGLGIQFLRHVERSKVLLFMLDAQSDDQLRDYNTLINELVKYNPEMVNKKRIIAISRCDTVEEERLEEIRNIKIEGATPLLLSSITRMNLNDLVYKLYDIVQNN